MLLRLLDMDTCIVTAREGDLEIIINDPNIICWDVDSRYE